MPPQPQQNNGLDPQLVTLAKAIRQTESGGDFQAKGASGEHGAYQFLPSTWAAKSQEAGVNVPLEQATPEQQNEVAYKTLATWKQQHPDWNIGNFASAWNAGEGAPNAYQGNAGVNAEGVKYDTKSYAEKVATAYHQFKSQGGYASPQVGGEQSPQAANVAGYEPPTPPPQTAFAGANQTTDSGETFSGDLAQGNYGGAAVQGAKNVVNMAFPVIPDILNAVQGKNDKSALQIAGDAGLSALWFLPFGDIAEGVGAGARAVGLGAKAAQTAGVVGTGVGTGYAADVANNLSQGKTDASVATPGLGTLLGGALPTAGIAAGGLYNKFLGDQAMLSKVQRAYEDAFGATKTGIQAGSKVVARGSESPAEFLAHAGLPPETAEINGRRVFTTGEDSNTYKTIQQRAKDLTALRDSAIENTNGVSNLNALRNTALKGAESEFSGTEREAMQKHLDKEFEAYSQQFPVDKNGDISVSDMNKIKKDLQGKTKYDATRPSAVTRANKLAARLAKKQVEKDAQKAGVPGIDKLNKIIQQHLDFLNTGGRKGLLAKLNGQTIKGGRLGTYVKEGIGAGVGSAAGGALGGGLLGQIGGGLAGAKGGEMVSRWLQKLSVGGPMTAATLGRMARQEPEVVQQFLRRMGREGEEIAPRVQPSATKSGASFIQGLLNRSPGNALNKESPKGVGEIPKLGQQKITDPNQFERATDLSPEHQALEHKAFQHIVQNEDAILSAYKAKHGNVVNADNFRPFFKDLGYAGHNAAAVQEPSSYLAKRARTQAIENNSQLGAIAYAGGSGTGKTSAIKNIPELDRLSKDSSVVLDSNFSTLSSAKKFIQEVEAKGKKFVGIFTYRDAVDSMVNGVVKRMLTNPEEMGRVVPTKVVAGNHIDSFDVVKKLAQDGHTFKFIDNSLGDKNSKVVSLQELQKKIQYPSKEDLTKIFNDKVTELYKNKIPFEDSRGVKHYITPEQYKSLTS